MKTETKRDRQLINRAAGKSGSYMPKERAESIARKRGLNDWNKSVVDNIRNEDQKTKKPIA